MSGQSENFVRKYLDPASRIGETLFGLMLFIVGQRWALYANTNRLVAGLAMVVIGLALVGVAILLGG